MTENPKSNARYFRWLGLAMLVLAIFAAVFYFARPRHGALPVMPDVPIDDVKMKFAIQRLQTRARTVSFSAYHRELLDTYHALNLAEVKGADPKELMALRQKFVEKTEIGQTARKERYLLMGDYLAVKFEYRLMKVLKEIRTKGLAKALETKSSDYTQLISISGNFLKEAMRSGLIGGDGQLRGATYMPQVLFRKRWRMLGEIPYRHQFLPMESLVDAAYQLRFGNPAQPELRLKAVQRIHRAMPEFNHQLATALIYYEGEETERARAIITRVLQTEPENFAMNQFLLFLTNDTKL